MLYTRPLKTTQASLGWLWVASSEGVTLCCSPPRPLVILPVAHRRPQSASVWPGFSGSFLRRPPTVPCASSAMCAVLFASVLAHFFFVVYSLIPQKERTPAHEVYFFIYLLLFFTKKAITSPIVGPSFHPSGNNRQCPGVSSSGLAHY